MATSVKIKKPSKSKNCSPVNCGTPPKKKRPTTPVGLTIIDSETAEVEESPILTIIPDTPEVKINVPIFKDKNFVHSTKGACSSKKNKVWKNLKQIIASERQLPWEEGTVTYGSIDAPPSFKPAKKYSDLSGLPALYVDPQTKICYANSQEFSRIRMLPSDLVTGYLALRKANTPVP